jgi:hypothetical protein
LTAAGVIRYMKRLVLALVILFVVAVAAWYAATESGLPTGGFSREAAVSAAKTHVISSAPITERGSSAGPYLLLGWQVRDARNPFAMVWRVSLDGVFDGHCLPSEVNFCRTATSADVVINYFNGTFVTVFYS